MKKKLLDFIVCPKTKEPLKLEVTEFDEEYSEIKTGKLTSVDGTVYPIIDYVPRFVATEEHSGSFNMQWKILNATQYSTEENLYSEKQLRKLSGLTPETLKGKLVLNAGCRSGRFVDIFEKWGAEVIGVDSSSAIDSAMEILGKRRNVNLIQASFFELPFKKEIFDMVWNYGSLVSTPDTQKAFYSLVPHIKKGGLLGIWIYSDYNKLYTFFSHLWRKITVRLPERILYYLCFLSVPLYFIYRIPIIGHLLRNIFIINTRKKWRWRVSETFDWYGQKYQWKHRYPEVFQWYNRAGFQITHMAEPPTGMVGRKNNFTDEYIIIKRDK